VRKAIERGGNERREKTGKTMRQRERAGKEWVERG